MICRQCHAGGPSTYQSKCIRCHGSGRAQVLCIHGVNNGYYSTWFQDFQIAIPYADTFPGPWPSTGSFSGDSIHYMLKAHRDHWLTYVQDHIDRLDPDVIVAHSMGTVLALQAETEIPLVLIGSPLHHRALGPLMRSKMGKIRVDGVRSFWHDRDPITWGGTKNEFESEQIEVSGSGDQHRAELYLDHPAVRGAICASI